MLKYVNHDIVFQEFPDEVTLAINLSLCPNRCPGCHSVALQGDIGDELTAERLLGLLEDYRGEVTCVGFMGGDNDPESVMTLAKRVKEHFSHSIKTGWYSGREQLPDCYSADCLDYVKLGAYVAARGPLNKPTTNQRLYCNTANGETIDITQRFWRC